MTAKRGTGLLMVWADVPAAQEPEFNRWYNEEHLAERLAVTDSPAYKKVQANPTPWTQRVGPQAIATAFIRNIYTMIHPRALSPTAAASGPAPALQLGRMDVPAEVDAEFNDWYNTIYVPNYEKVPGV